MYKFKTNENKTLFLTISSNFSYREKVNIILSPELYWVRIFEIPILSKKDALNVVHTFFEDFGDFSEHKFYAIKQDDNRYLCFAYSEDEILETIKNANLNLNQISNIYFAQNEFMDQDIFKLDNQYFTYQDDILIKFPKEFINIDEVQEHNLLNIKLSKDTISLNKVSKYIDNKSLYILSTVFVIMALINFTKVYMLNDTINNIQTNQEQIKQQYKMLPTMIQTKSVMKTLNSKKQNQINLRKALKHLFNFNAKIQRVELINNKLTIYFENISMDKVKAHLSKKYKIFKSNELNDIVVIGIKI